MTGSWDQDLDYIINPSEYTLTFNYSKNMKFKSMTQS